MAKDTTCRKWQITINNPLDKGYTHLYILEQLEKLMPKNQEDIYYCFSDEIGLEEKTPHTHIFIWRKMPIRFSTIKNLFDGGHFEPARGTCQQNRDYIRKEGKYADTEKQETNIKESFVEFNECPEEKQGKRNDIVQIYEMVEQGLSDYEILQANPACLRYIEKIDRVRQVCAYEQFKNVFRNLEVTYMCGDAGSGKTRYVMEKYGYQNVYRITDYKHPFDTYKNQDVIFFDEYRSQFDIGTFLMYLDGYPVDLPCRFNNKVACFTKVYIASNLPLERQYTQEQKENKSTWDAFLRRVHKVMLYSGDTVNIYDNVQSYLDRDNDFVPCSESDTPFEQVEMWYQK